MPVYTIGTRVKQPDAHHRRCFRTLYPVYRDGSLLAFVGMEQGFSKPWMLYPLTSTENLIGSGSDYSVEGHSPDRFSHSVTRLIHGPDPAYIEATLAMRNDTNFRTVAQLAERYRELRAENIKHWTSALNTFQILLNERTEELELLRNLIPQMPSREDVLTRLIVQVTEMKNEAEQNVFATNKRLAELAP